MKSDLFTPYGSKFEQNSGTFFYINPPFNWWCLWISVTFIERDFTLDLVQMCLSQRKFWSLITAHMKSATSAVSIHEHASRNINNTFGCDINCLTSILKVFLIVYITSDLMTVDQIWEILLNITQYNSLTALTTASKMTINFNQHLWKTVWTKTEHYNLHDGWFIAGLLY